MKTSRREFLALGATTAMSPRALRAASTAPDRIADDLTRYVGFGIKAAGGVGDTASGEWLEAELRSAGFEVARQSFATPYFEPATATLESRTAVAEVIPQAVVVPGKVQGALAVVSAYDVPGDLTGSLALVQLPCRRWSSATAPLVRDSINAAIAAGAAAAVVVTNGPTGEAIALNAPADEPLFKRPAAILAPNDAGPFLLAAAARATATLTVEGRGGMRPAFNLVGRVDRGARRWIVVSTPRSGWFTCAGERGPGIAAWLALARWAASGLPACNLLFACNSGHEYENLGSAHLIQGIAPAPVDTALWLHLGANVAARDWHELLLPPRPLPSADPQRFLVVSPQLLGHARAAFAGLCGLEVPYASTDGGAGELQNILAAGYPRVAAIFGAHRYHHTEKDDGRTISPILVEPVVTACRRLLSAA